MERITSGQKYRICHWEFVWTLCNHRQGGAKSFRKQKTFGAKDVISEKSDFRHLNGLSRDEVISYFKSEISKLKGWTNLHCKRKTEELFRFKREKGSHSLNNDMEFEPLRKKIPEIISRMDQIIFQEYKGTCDLHDSWWARWKMQTDKKNRCFVLWKSASTRIAWR